jgi:hypothetical protein
MFGEQEIVPSFDIRGVKMRIVKDGSNILVYFEGEVFDRLLMREMKRKSLEREETKKHNLEISKNFFNTPAGKPGLIETPTKALSARTSTWPRSTSRLRSTT